MSKRCLQTSAQSDIQVYDGEHDITRCWKCRYLSGLTGMCGKLERVIKYAVTGPIPNACPLPRTMESR